MLLARDEFYKKSAAFYVPIDCIRSQGIVVKIGVQPPSS